MDRGGGGPGGGAVVRPVKASLPPTCPLGELIPDTVGERWWEGGTKKREKGTVEGKRIEGGG